MEPRKIVIGHPPRANMPIKIEVFNCAGNACRDLTRTIEQALGDVKSDTDKPEIHEEPEKERELA